MGRFDGVAEARAEAGAQYVCTSGSYAYLSRTPEQVAGQLDAAGAVSRGPQCHSDARYYIFLIYNH